MAREGLKVEERPFALEEASEAREAFITGAGTLLLPVVSIDGTPVGDGDARSGGETAAPALYRGGAADGALTRLRRVLELN